MNEVVAPVPRWDAATDEQPASQAYFMIRTVALRRGGLTRVMLARLRLYAQQGIPVTLLLAFHSPYEEIEEHDIRAAWGLSSLVRFRYFWREAAPNGGGAAVESLVHARSEPGLTSFAAEADERSVSTRLYDNGLLVKRKNYFRDSGQLYRIDRYDVAGRANERRYFDSTGCLVRADSVNPESGNPTLRRFFDRQGDCWLTVWFDKNHNMRECVRHLPWASRYDTYVDCVAEWVEQVLAESPSPVVFGDERELDRVLFSLRESTARRVAVIHNTHTYRNHGEHDPVKPNCQQLLWHAARLDSIVLLTSKQREHLARRFGCENTRVINHPAPESLPPHADRRDGVLIAISRFEERKQLDHAIRAFARALEYVPDAVFEIYGNGPEYARLQRLVTELGVTERVRFLEFTQRPLEKFSSATASVLTSTFEGFGLVLVEAMAMGTPFVSYDLNYGPAEVIRDGTDGMLVPQDDIEALAAGLVRLLGDPQYAQQLGTRAMEVVQRFSVERWRRDWLALYAELNPDRAGIS